MSVSYPLTSKFLNQFFTKGLIMLGSEEKCGVRLILPYPVDHLVFYHFLPSDAPFGLHIAFCVIFGIFFEFSRANIGVLCLF